MGRKSIENPQPKIRRAYDLELRSHEELLALSRRLKVSATAALNWLLLQVAPCIREDGSLAPPE